MRLISFLLATFFISASLPASGQKNKTPKKTCPLISSTQLNTLLSTRVTLDTDGYWSDDAFLFSDKKQDINKIELSDVIAVRVRYTKFPDDQQAYSSLQRQKKVYDDDIDGGESRTSGYDSLFTFPIGGHFSYEVIGNSKKNRKKVRCEFVLNHSIVTVETTGIDVRIVDRKLPEVYKAIKNNFH